MTVDIHLHHHDLPEGLDLGAEVAVDTEAMGLIHGRDRLCLVQLSAGDGTCHLVQIAAERRPAPRLAGLLHDPDILKLFHYARFDMAGLFHSLGAMPEPVYCTKIASRLARTYTDRHSLRDLCRELLGVELQKVQQSSDWGAAELSDAQKQYAASDVLHLHGLRRSLDRMLLREGRLELAQSCFAFLPTRVRLDLEGWPEVDIFAHS